MEFSDKTKIEEFGNNCSFLPRSPICTQNLKSKPKRQKKRNCAVGHTLLLNQGPKTQSFGLISSSRTRPKLATTQQQSDLLRSPSHPVHSTSPLSVTLPQLEPISHTQPIISPLFSYLTLSSSHTIGPIPAAHRHSSIPPACFPSFLLLPPFGPLFLCLSHGPTGQHQPNYSNLSSAHIFNMNQVIQSRLIN